jgi:hypothetical protein
LAGAVCALVATLVAGCGEPVGTDGDLTDDWAALPAPTPFVPQADVCHPSAEDTGYLSTYTLVDCARVHQAETVYVGRFPAPYADRSTPPGVGSAAVRAAFPTCDAKARQFVGADWRGARMTVRIVFPSPRGWAGGERWFRCDLTVLDQIGGGTVLNHPEDHPVDQVGSLRDILRHPSPLAYTCFTDTKYFRLVPTACGKTHRYEYVGIWTTPLPSLALITANHARVWSACRSVIAAYVHIPDDGTMANRAGVDYVPPSPEAWARGDRGVRCLLWSDNRELTRSVKGAGPSALPLRRS